MSRGTLYGVGVGPGDPELITVKARRIIASCAVVAYFAARRKQGNGFAVVEPMLEDRHCLLRLTYPVTTEAVDPTAYEQSMAGFYAESAASIAAHLEAGRDVAVVCEGDPFFYGSYMYIHQRLAHRFDTEVVPGITSVSAASAAAGRPLVSMNESLTVLPGLLPPDRLEEAMTGADAAVIMKVGRHLADIRDVARACGMAEGAVYVERASCDGQRVMPLLETDDVDAPYFSLVLIPGTHVAER
ncbi:MAG: precorrin-2 C(20)-methyltransferase [Acidimicrobiales bacterium]